MNIRLSDSTGRPEPQFIVEAETKEDEMFLKSFLTAPDYSKDNLKFEKHGHLCQDGKYKSFNFGWVKKDK